MTTVDDPSPDADLLRDVADHQSNEAFRLLVSRYVDLVHSAASRQIRESHLVEEITQAVFLLLWQRARSIQTHRQLGGWLLLATRNVANNLRKHEQRLKRRERKVAMMNPEQDPSQSSGGAAILPLLDDAIARLGDTDRDAIVERFFHSKSHHEVGAKLGVTEQAATKRVSRALGKLRLILERQGVTANDTLLSGLLVTTALKPAAPTVLVASIHSTIPAGASSSAVTALAKGAGTAVGKSTALSLIGAGIAAMIIVGGVVMNLHKHPISPSVQTAVAPKVLNVAAPVIPAVAESRTVTLSILDKQTEKPIDGAQVQVQLEGKSQPARPANADGKFAFTTPLRFQYLGILVHAPGRVPMGLTFQNYTIRGDLLASYTIPMEKGTRIGGIVTDENGDPLGDAEIRLSIYASSPDTPAPMLDGDVIRTDADGKWHFDNAPAKFDQLYLRVEQTGFPKGQGFGQITSAQLHAETYTAVLKRHLGAELDGIVLDPNGKPVQGAMVVAASDRYESDKPTSKTDADGKFHLQNIHDDYYQVIVTVTLKGYAPAQVSMPGADKSLFTKPLEIHLAPPGGLARCRPGRQWKTDQRRARGSGAMERQPRAELVHQNGFTREFHLERCAARSRATQCQQRFHGDDSGSGSDSRQGADQAHALPRAENSRQCH